MSKRHKLILFLLLLVLNYLPLYSLENSRYYYWSDAGGDWFFEFSDNTFTLYDFDQSAKNKIPLPGFEDDVSAVKISGTYKIQEIGNNTYMSVENRRYLMLVDENKYCFLYENGSKKNVYMGVNSKYLVNQKRKTPLILTPEFDNYIRIGNHLAGGTRDGISYSPPFSRISYDSVWAFPILNQQNNWIELFSFNKTKNIILCSGFVYPKNMQLYYYNARPKTIVLMYNNQAQTVILKDSPSPQVINLNEEISEESYLKISISDYYPGTKYNDCVISFIGFLGTRY